MIVVTGSMRSGTSMWMQILIAAGLPHLGEAFPAPWGDPLRDANPRGFFESSLVSGIYHATNPHPETGDYLAPAQTRGHVVKVFIPGLIRSDVAFLDRVIATVRPVREVATSTARLTELVADARGSDPASDAGIDGGGIHERGIGGIPGGIGGGVRRIDEGLDDELGPALRWWLETFSLVRDVATRGYPAHVTTYNRLLRDPLREVRVVTDWLGTGNPRAGAAAVDPSLRTVSASDAPLPIEPRHLAVFDELYAHLDEGRALSPSFVARLNTTDQELRPALQAAHARVRTTVAARLAQEAIRP